MFSMVHDMQFQTKWLKDELFKLWFGPAKKFNEAASRICLNSLNFQLGMLGK